MIQLVICFFLLSVSGYALEVREIEAQAKISSFRSLVGNSALENGGKKIYKANGNIIQASTNIIGVKLNISKAIKEINAEKENRLTVKERQAYIEKHFTSREELLRSKSVAKEVINAETELIKYFNSLNNTVEKPINIE